MEDKIYILERWGGIYVGATRMQLSELLTYVVKEVPRIEELITKMIEQNLMSAIYGEHLLRAYSGNHVCWFNLSELDDEEDEYFDRVYDMIFEFV